MHTFNALIQKHKDKGEKTGWTFIFLPKDIHAKLKLKDKKGFRIQGVIDNVKFEKLSVYPVGNGEYIIALNAALRKSLGKKEGATVSVKLTLDDDIPQQSQELLDCLAEDKIASTAFNALLRSHRNYHHSYVASAKTDATRTARIVNVINAMYKKQTFGEMIRSLKEKK